MVKPPIPTRRQRPALAPAPAPIYQQRDQHGHPLWDTRFIYVGDGKSPALDILDEIHATGSEGFELICGIGNMLFFKRPRMTHD